MTEENSTTPEKKKFNPTQIKAAERARKCFVDAERSQKAEDLLSAQLNILTGIKIGRGANLGEGEKEIRESLDMILGPLENETSVAPDESKESTAEKIKIVVEALKVHLNRDDYVEFHIELVEAAQELAESVGLKGDKKEIRKNVIAILEKLGS